MCVVDHYVESVPPFIDGSILKWLIRVAGTGINLDIVTINAKLCYGDLKTIESHPC